MFILETVIKNKVDVHAKKLEERREEALVWMLEELDKIHDSMKLKSSERESQRKLVETFTRFGFDTGFSNGWREAEIWINPYIESIRNKIVELMHICDKENKKLKFTAT